MSEDKKDEKPLTKSDLTSALFEFYDKFLEPRFRGLIQEEMQVVRVEVQDLKNKMLEHFDDLYKKFEDLHLKICSRNILLPTNK